jgi:acetylornithine deacetylase
MNSAALLKTLVGFDTTSRESNLQLIEFVRDYLAASMCRAS